MRRGFLSLVALGLVGLAGCYCSHGVCDCICDDHCCTREPWIAYGPPPLPGPYIGLGAPIGPPVDVPAGAPVGPPVSVPHDAPVAPAAPPVETAPAPPAATPAPPVSPTKSLAPSGAPRF